MNEGSLFNEEPRTIPAEQVTVDTDGSRQANLSLEQIESAQAFAPDLLK